MTSVFRLRSASGEYRSVKRPGIVESSTAPPIGAVSPLWPLETLYPTGQVRLHIKSEYPTFEKQEPEDEYVDVHVWHAPS